MRDFEFFLEITQRLDAVGRTLDLLRIEGIALGQTEFAPHHLVLRQRIAVNVNPFDINARCLGNVEINPHRQRLGIAVVSGAHVGKGIAKSASGFVQPVDRVFDQLGIIPVALFHWQILGQHCAIKIAQLAFNLHVAEFVAFPFLDHIGDNEIALVGG